MGTESQRLQSDLGHVHEQDRICQAPKPIHPSPSRSKDSKAGGCEGAAEEQHFGQWRKMEKYTKQRERKAKLEVRPQRTKGACFGVRPCICGLQDTSGAALPLKAGCTCTYGSHTRPGMGAIISPATLGASVLLHILCPHPHHRPVLKPVSVPTWAHCRSRRRGLQRSCVSDLG